MVEERRKTTGRWTATRTGVLGSRPLTHKIHKIVYGQKGFDAEVMLRRYRSHNAEVRRWFGKNLLVVDFTKDAGWHELCGFLHEPLPSVPFPREMSRGAASKRCVFHPCFEKGFA